MNRNPSYMKSKSANKDQYNSKEYFGKYIDFLYKESLYPTIHEITGYSHEPRIKVKGKYYLSFSSNNYLGLSGNRDIKDAIKKAIDKYGVGSGGTRLVSGTLDIQVEFEKKFSNYFGFEDSITFSSGYLANVGVIRMLIDPFPYFQLSEEKPGIIISDELNHASIIDGVRLSKSTKEIYRHSNMKDLEDILKRYQHHRKLIITDGVFSMDGDLANLKDITKLSKKYGAILMIDDSHAVGVLGPKGRGTAHYLGVEKDVDVIMGSFTKAFGSLGGFVVGKKEIINYLRVTSRSYIFSDPIPPSFVAGLITATDIIYKSDIIRKKTLKNSHLLRSGLRKLGFIIYGENTNIIPLIIGDERKTIDFSNMLVNNGIISTCVRRPVVTPGKERIRFSVMATHTESDIKYLIDKCESIGKMLNMI